MFTLPPAGREHRNPTKGVPELCSTEEGKQDKTMTASCKPLIEWSVTRTLFFLRDASVYGAGPRWGAQSDKCGAITWHAPGVTQAIPCEVFSTMEARRDARPIKTLAPHAPLLAHAHSDTGDARVLLLFFPLSVSLSLSPLTHTERYTRHLDSRSFSIVRGQGSPSENSSSLKPARSLSGCQ